MSPKALLQAKSNPSFPFPLVGSLHVQSTSAPLKVKQTYNVLNAIFPSHHIALSSFSPTFLSFSTQILTRVLT